MNLRVLIVAVLGIALGALGGYTAKVGSLPGFLQGGLIKGKAKIGGPFTLTDHNGRKVTDKTFRGKYMLVYFGFTYCPDVCPGELQVMSDALRRLGSKSKRIAPLFITIDPERDTVEQMASYVPNFSPQLIGLTGTPKQIRDVARAYKVFFNKVKDKGSSDGYTMDHSSIIYLMGPSGEFITHFPHGTTSKAIAKRLASII